MRDRGLLLRLINGWSGCAAPVVAQSPFASASRAAGRALCRLLVAGLALACLGASGCAAAAGDAATVAPVAGREDLTVLSLHAHVAGGLSEPVSFELPAG